MNKALQYGKLVVYAILGGLAIWNLFFVPTVESWILLIFFTGREFLKDANKQKKQ